MALNRPGKAAVSRAIRIVPKAADVVSIPEYRGQRISKIERPIRLTTLKEVYINPRDAFDQGVLQYFTKRGIATRDEDGGKVAYLRPTGEDAFRLDEILNAKKTVEDSLLDKMGISKYLPEHGVGVLGVGRTKYAWHPSKEDFNDDYALTLEEFVSNLKENPAALRSFMEIGDSLNYNVNIDSLVDIDKDKFAQIQTGWLLKTMASLAPNHAAFLQNPQESLNADIFFDRGITRWMYDDNSDIVKSAGMLIHIGKSLYWVQPNSTYGSTVVLPQIKPDKILPLLRRELELDEKDTVLNRNAGKGKLENHVNALHAGSSISLLRQDSDSPITFVPIADLSSPDEQTAIISMGMINPLTRRQQSSLVVKVDKL